MVPLRTTDERKAILAAVVAFVVLAGTSMAAYPGGTSWDPATRGHDFWRNFLCDLVRGTSLGGTPNPIGSAFGKAAMLVLAAGLLPFFVRVTTLARGTPRLGLAVRITATIAVLAVPAVAFVSGDRFGKLHAVAVVAAGVPGLAACAGAVVALVLDPRAPRDVRWAGVVAAALGIVDFLLYLASLSAHDGGPIAVAVLERLATLALLAWMALAANRAPHPAPLPEASQADAPRHPAVVGRGHGPPGVSDGSRA